MITLKLYAGLSPKGQIEMCDPVLVSRLWMSLGPRLFVEVYNISKPISVLGVSIRVLAGLAVEALYDLSGSPPQ